MADWTAAEQRRAWDDHGQRVPMLICRSITREQQRTLIEETRAARLKGQALLTPIRRAFARDGSSLGWGSAQQQTLNHPSVATPDRSLHTRPNDRSARYSGRVRRFAQV